MVEGARLESVYAGQLASGVRIPPLPPEEGKQPVRLYGILYIHEAIRVESKFYKAKRWLADAYLRPRRSFFIYKIYKELSRDKDKIYLRVWWGNIWGR